MPQEVNIPENVHCSKSHEYIRIEDGYGYIGITKYATEQLGEIVYVELPEIGATVTKGETFGTVESVKAASELYSPVNGKIAEVNERLTSEPELINEDCYNAGWIAKVSDFNEEDLADTLLMEDYLTFIEE